MQGRQLDEKELMQRYAMNARLKIFRNALSMFALSFLLAGAAHAQTSAQPTKKSASQSKHTTATPPVPQLEPKAIELLKASSARSGPPTAQTGSTTAWFLVRRGARFRETQG